MTNIYTFYQCPLGQILLIANGDALTGLYFVGEKYYPDVMPDWKREDQAKIFRATTTQLQEYFSGARQSFELTLAPQGTEFQRKVWHALTQLKFGEIVSYGELALRIGQPQAFRAVGAANGRNPISIVVPCHRVIGARGALTGYAGGLPRKEALLNLEAVASPCRFSD